MWFVKTRFVQALQDRHRNLALLIGIVAVIVRLLAIDQPFIDEWSWRQSDVASIARNYFQHGFQFAYPQIDWAGDQPGYVGTEFPILPFVAAVCYKFTGVHEWVGRVQAVILFALALPFFFLLLRGIFGATAATWAIFFYSFAPLNIFAGRAFMPDVPSLGLALIGLYLFWCWIEQERSIPLWIAAAFVSLSILIKLPTIIIGAPLLCLAWQKFGGRFLRQPSLWFFAAIALLPSLVWYWHAHQVAEEFYPHHFFGAGGVRLENPSWYWTIAKLIATSNLTPLILIAAVLGAFMTRSTRAARLFHAWLFSMILFIIVVGYGNRHSWYQLPLIPIAAAFAGAACALVAVKVESRGAKISLSILLASCFGILSLVYARPFYRPLAGQLRDAGLELKRTTAPDSLIVAADTGDPAIFYYAERKGWHFLEKDAIYEGNPLDSAQVIADLTNLRKRGATHLVLTANTFWWLEYYKEFAEHLAHAATLKTVNSQFKIYELTPQE